MNDFLTKYCSGYGLKDKQWSGCPRKTTVRVDKIIKRKSTADPRKTASDIARELKQENHITVIWCTVSRRLNDVGLIGRVAVKKPFISKKNQKAQLILLSNIESGFWKIGRESLFRMNRSSICLGTLADDMFDVLLVHGMIVGTKYPQLSMVEGACLFGEYFQQMGLVHSSSLKE